MREAQLYIVEFKWKQYLLHLSNVNTKELQCMRKRCGYYLLDGYSELFETENDKEQ